MKIVRYVNNQKVKAENLPPIEISNPAVIQIIRNVIEKANSCTA